MNDDVRAILEQARPAGWAVEPLAKEALRLYGVPVTRFGWARTTDEAVSLAGDIGYPVVAKVVSPEVIHKSDVGGVAVNLKDASAVTKAFETMSALEGFDGVLIDQMVKFDVELIVGAKHDPSFGMVVLVGIGGTSVEIYKDVAIRMAPLTEGDAEDALSSLTGKALIEGFRGSAPVDREKLKTLLVTFSEAAYELRDEIESIDLNPVLCGPDVAVVADARLMLSATGADKT